MAFVQTRGDRHTGYYRDAKGNRISAGTFDTRDDALNHARIAEAGGDISGGYRLTMTLQEYVGVWLDNVDLLPSTKCSYESVLATHVFPILGRRKLTEISRVEVRDMLRKLSRDGVSDSVRVHVKSALGSAYKELIESDLIDANPTHKVRVRQVGHNRPARVLEEDEFKAIRDALPTPAASLLAQFLVLVGTRFGETTELRVGDIDPRTREVYVQRRVLDLGGSRNGGERFRVIEGTKSGLSRTVTVGPELIDALTRHITEHNLGTNDLLFPKSLVTAPHERARALTAEAQFTVGNSIFTHGQRSAYTRGKCRCAACAHANAEYHAARRRISGKTPTRTVLNVSDHLPRDTWRRMWIAAVGCSGVDWTPKTHGLRHANASHLLKNGVDLHEVKERLGHSSIQTTEGYLHRVKAQSSVAAAAVASFI